MTHHTRLVPALAAWLLPAALLSCVSLPPESQSTATTALGGGRTVYHTGCARCHAPEPVRRYSAAQWQKILPRMIAKAKLNPADARAVSAYVRSELGL